MRDDLDVDADLLELRLHLRRDVLVEETLVDAHLHRQRLAVLLDDAVAVAVRVACRGEHSLCLLCVKCADLERGITERRCGEECAAGGGHRALEHVVADGLFVHAVHDRLAHGGIGQLLKVEIELVGARLRCLDERVLVRLCNRLRRLGAQIERDVDLARLERRCERVKVRNARVLKTVELHLAAPVRCILFHDGGFLRVKCGQDKGPRADGGVVEILCSRDVDNDGVRIAEIVDERSVRLFRLDGEDIALRREHGVLQPCRAVVRLGGALQGLDDFFGGHLLAVGERDVILQRDAPDRRFDILRLFREPRLCLHLVVQTEQCLADAVAHGIPAVPVLRRIHRAARDGDGAADVDDLFAARCRGVRAAAAGERDRQGDHQSRTQRFTEIEFHVYLLCIKRLYIQRAAFLNRRVVHAFWDRADHAAGRRTG